MDQYFAVPQIGEVIRDLLILQRLSEVIDKVTKKSDTQASQDIIPEEEENRVEILKVLDPALVNSLILL